MVLRRGRMLFVRAREMRIVPGGVMLSLWMRSGVGIPVGRALVTARMARIGVMIVVVWLRRFVPWVRSVSWSVVGMAVLRAMVGVRMFGNRVVMVLVWRRRTSVGMMVAGYVVRRPFLGRCGVLVGQFQIQNVAQAAERVVRLGMMRVLVMLRVVMVRVVMVRVVMVRVLVMRVLVMRVLVMRIGVMRVGVVMMGLVPTRRGGVGTLVVRVVMLGAVGMLSPSMRGVGCAVSGRGMAAGRVNGPDASP